LQEISVTVINGMRVCDLSGYDETLVYCAIGVVNGSNACYGDSGGPMQSLVDGKWYFYGLASYVLTNLEKICAPTLPSFYTKIPRYLDWITNNMNLTNYAIDVKSNSGMPQFVSRIKVILIFYCLFIIIIIS